jgi:hypothetical protein
MNHPGGSGVRIENACNPARAFCVCRIYGENKYGQNDYNGFQRPNARGHNLAKHISLRRLTEFRLRGDFMLAHLFSLASRRSKNNNASVYLDARSFVVILVEMRHSASPRFYSGSSCFGSGSQKLKINPTA